MVRKRLTREESKAKTRQDLIRAANRLFLRNGYVATSLANIAEEAALTKGAVYSNFESKEDLFLALLQESDPEWTAPHDTAAATTGTTPAERAASFGKYAASQRPSRKQVAMFLEMNAVALRSERPRQWVASHNDAFFAQFGQRLGAALGMETADPKLLGFIAQSLYVGLLTHSAFNDDDTDDDTFAKAYELLAGLGDS